MGILQRNLATLISTTLRADNEDLNNFSVAEFTAVFVRAPTAPGTRFLPTGEAASARGEIVMNLDTVPSSLIRLSLEPAMRALATWQWVTLLVL